MLAPSKLMTIVGAAAVMLLLVSLTACKQPPKPPPPKPKVAYSDLYDREIKEIMDLAAADKWEEAQTKVSALYQKDPKNPMVDRVHTWVLQSRQRQREKALENKIRDVEAKSSVFNPTIESLITEKKDRGLPASKDVRDTLHRIENAPYIPDTYGKTIFEKGPLFDLESTKGHMAKVLEKKVWIHLDNIPLETALMKLSETAQINIVADKSIPALKQVLQMTFTNVSMGEFLRYVARNYDLQFQVGDELVWVVDAKDPKRLMEETKYYRLRKGFVLPAELGSDELVRQVVTTGPNVTLTTDTTKFKKFVNDQAPPMPSIERAIKELFVGPYTNAPGGTNAGPKYIIDYERNMIMARGTPEQLAVLERIIEEFDRPIQQVLIEARFVTLTKPAFLQLGALWENGGQSGGVRNLQDFTGIINNQNFPTVNLPGSATPVPAVGIGIQNVFTNVLNSEDLKVTISALEQSGESQTLSAPRLTVLNNRPATISDGKVQYYYEEYAVKQTVQQYYTASSFVPSGKPTKITSGAELNVLASISGDGKSIVLALNPRVNTDVQLVKYTTIYDYNQNGVVQNQFDINLPQYRTQDLSTRVVVKSGETVVMGGVLERQKSTLVESVPVLGDLPLIGWLFRRRTEVDTPRYLLVFVTATIVKDTGEFLVYEDEHSGTNAPTLR